MNQISERLTQLTDKLVNMRDLSSEDGSGMREYKLAQGYAMAAALMFSDEVAVSKSFLSSGTIFPLHRHDRSCEILIVYAGEVTVVTEEARHSLRPGDSLRIENGVAHMLHAKTDVKIIAVTIPPDELAMPKERI